MQYLIPSLLLAISAAAIIWLNVRYYRERAMLTPEQRAEEDEQLRQQAMIY